MKGSECKFCGSGKVPSGFDICAWCIKTIEDTKKFVDSMPVPGYCQGDRWEREEEADIPHMD